MLRKMDDKQLDSAIAEIVNKYQKVKGFEVRFWRFYFQVVMS